MQLTILSPTTKEIHDISWIELNTPTGNYVIQPGHAPMVVSLSTNQSIIFLLSSGATEKRKISQGIAQINRTHITLLISS